MTQVDAIVKLLRFLHYGKEDALYTPGNRIANFYFFDKDNLECIDELLELGRERELLEALRKTFNAKTSIHPECAIFVLALCAQELPAESKTMVYRMMCEFCDDSSSFLLFHKFCSKLSAPETGWGRGRKESSKKWYSRGLDSDPQSLMRKILSAKSFYKWSHKDVLKLTHMKPENPVMAVTLTCVTHGLEAAEQLADKCYPEDVGVKQLLQYVQAIEKLKKEENIETAAQIIGQNKIERQNLPTGFLQKVEVWHVLLPSLSLKEVLDSFNSLNRYGFLKPDSLLCDDIVKKLESEETDIQPTDVFIVKKIYENPVRVQNLLSERNHPRSLKSNASVPPNPAVVDALNNLFEKSFKNLTSTGKRWLISVDVRQPMRSGKCWSQGVVHPSEAAALIISSVLKSEPEENVTVCAFGHWGVTELNATRGMTYSDVLRVMEEARSGMVVLAAPIEWALKNEKNYDMIVVITDMQVRPYGFLPAGATPRPTDPIRHRELLRQYRLQRNLPHTRMATVALSLRYIKAADPDDAHQLDCTGFDATTPRVLRSFASEVF